jgi:hypothetical protein
LSRLKRLCLAEECAKLDPTVEQELAEEGFVAEVAEWPDHREPTIL